MRPLRLPLLMAGLLLAAAKPVPREAPTTVDDAHASYRGRGISVCVAELRNVPDLSPDDLEAICGCAVDRFIQSRAPARLPEIARGRFRGTMEGQLISCTAQVRPDRTGEVARGGIGATVPPSPSEPVALPSPGDKPEPAEEAPPERPAGPCGGPRSWLSGLELPAWLTGPWLWVWVGIGIFLFGLAILALRRRDPRGDLVGPPAHMRRGLPPAAPRRPDLPR